MDFVQCLLHRPLKAVVTFGGVLSITGDILFVKIADQIRDYFGVRFGFERTALFDEPFFKMA